jgi:hypothetical protein
VIVSLRLDQLISGSISDPALAFVERAFGLRRAEYGIPATQLAGVEMPGALRRFYEFAGSWPDLYRQNRILAPAELRREGDRLTFFEENQAVFEWATGLGGDDAAVWSREPESEWAKEAAPLSFFLFETLLCEYVMGGAPAMASGDGEPTPVSEIERVSGLMTEVPYGAWGGGDYFRFPLYVAPEAVLMLDTEGYAWIGASSEAALLELGIDAHVWSMHRRRR